MDLDAALQTYVAESRELLQEMEDVLLRAEQDGLCDSDDLNAIFRAAHTIKGSAGLFGLTDIVDFTHGVETLLDRARDGELQVGSDVAALLLKCRDHISDLLDVLEQDGKPGDELQRVAASLTEQLHSAGAAPAEGPATTMPSAMPEPAVERMRGEAVDSDNWHISLRFGEDTLRDGMDPLSFIRYLQNIGEVISITTLDNRMPPLAEMDPESCYLGMEINFRSDADKQTIENVFEFIREESRIRILPPNSRIDAYVELIGTLPEEDLKIGEILVQCGSLTEAELHQALGLQQAMRDSNVERPIGSIVVETGMTAETVLDAAVVKQQRVREKAAREAQSIRVDAEKLDQLINMVGELVIAGASASVSAENTGNLATIESIANLCGLVESVRDAALRLRMVQIGGTFNRFQRVVRDLSQELGKDIDLKLSGGDTELDKTVVERIGDPLMHLVRNAIDHGIESADRRRAAGKSETGAIRLNAYHDSGSIIIEVGDDGAGLDRDAIFNKAVAKGLIAPDAELDEQDVFNLIFEPGFSTADSVTNVSGRGVGMDVVKRNIHDLRGEIELESEPGKGTTFRVRLPLTLAIIDGFQVVVNGSSFVLPLDMVVECVELHVRKGAEEKSDYINLRGEVLPFVRLRELFSLGGGKPRRESVVVVQYGNAKAGLVVDQLRGELQAVIKPLGRIFSHVSGLAGSTILGSGEVALILDVPGVVQQVSSGNTRAFPESA